jgi:hypothetical protein
MARLKSLDFIRFIVGIVYLFAVLGIEHGASHMLGEHSAT